MYVLSRLIPTLTAFASTLRPVPKFFDKEPCFSELLIKKIINLTQNNHKKLSSISYVNCLVLVAFNKRCLENPFQWIMFPRNV